MIDKTLPTAKKKNMEEITMKKQMKERTMDYAEFFEAIAKGLREDEKLNLNNARITLFADGSVSKCKEDDKLIQNINYRYFQNESKIVRGDWIVVYKQDGTVCEIPLRQLYQLHRHLGGDMKLVWHEIYCAFNGCQERYPWLRGIWEYERMKEHLTMRIVPLRKSTCDGCVGFTYGDMAIVLCDNSEADEEKARVQHECLGYWCQEEMDVLRETFNHMLDKYAPDIDMKLDEDVKDVDYAQLHLHTDIHSPIIISNKNDVDGAIALYYPGVQQAISAMIGFGNFYSIMPTFEKALVFPASRVTEQQVRDRLREILRETPEEKVLSKQVCYYNSKKNSLDVI